MTLLSDGLCEGPDGGCTLSGQWLGWFERLVFRWAGVWDFSVAFELQIGASASSDLSPFEGLLLVTISGLWCDGGSSCVCWGNCGSADLSDLIRIWLVSLLISGMNLERAVGGSALWRLLSLLFGGDGCRRWLGDGLQSVVTGVFGPGPVGVQFWVPWWWMGLGLLGPGLWVLLGFFFWFFRGTWAFQPKFVVVG